MFVDALNITITSKTFPQDASEEILTALFCVARIKNIKHCTWKDVN